MMDPFVAVVFVACILFGSSALVLAVALVSSRRRHRALRIEVHKATMSAESWRAIALAAEARARGVGGLAGVKPSIDRVQA